MYTNLINMLFDSSKINCIWKLLTIPIIIVINSPTNAFDTHQLNGKHLYVIWVRYSLVFFIVVVFAPGGKLDNSK